MAIDKAALKNKLLALEADDLETAEQAYRDWLASVRIDRDMTIEEDDLAQSSTHTDLAQEYGKQVQDHNEHIRQIEAIEWTTRDVVELGAIVKLAGSERHLVIATPTAAFECEGSPYIGVSPTAPIVAAMAGLEQGDDFDFQGHEYTIELVA